MFIFLIFRVEGKNIEGVMQMCNERKKNRKNSLSQNIPTNKVSNFWSFLWGGMICEFRTECRCHAFPTFFMVLQ